MAGESILIVEDEEIIKEMITETLEDFDYKLITAANGEKGLELFKSHRPILVILDLKMPVIDGIEFLRKIKLSPAAPFSAIILTGHGDDQDVKTCFHLGVYAFLRKPFNVYEFKGLVKHSISLKMVQLDFEKSVKERTLELEAANRQLTDEISVRKEVEKELKKAKAESEAKYLSVMDDASDAILLSNLNGDILDANKRALLLFGYAKEEIIGMNYKEFHPEDELGRCVKIFTKIVLQGEGSITHTAIVRKDGKRVPVDITGSKIVYGDKEILLGSFRDITDRLRLQTEAIHVSKLSTLGELAAGVAHEINNPVYGIMNCAQLVMDKSDQSDLVNKLGKDIMHLSERIGNIVNNLLSFARSKGQEKCVVTVMDIILDSLKLTETQIKKDGIDIEIGCSQRLPDIEVFAQEIQQVLINVMQNARYALNAKYPEFHKEKKLIISCKEPMINSSPFISIEVYDRGIGIPGDILDRVMDPFFTTKPPKKGTGLGLSICNRIINDHGGRLTIESEDGEYTKVIIMLPVK